MTTPRIDEYGEWDIEVDGVKYAGKRSLTKVRQETLDEAVGLLQTLKKEIPKTSRKPFELAENVGKQMVLDEAIKALQDNKYE